MPFSPAQAAVSDLFVSAAAPDDAESTCLLDRARGAASRVVFQEETCWGVRSNAQIPRGLDFVTEGMANQINRIESQLIRSNRMRRKSQQGNQRPDGDLNGELQPMTVPIILKNCLCRTSDVTTTGSGPYQHVFQGQVEIGEGLTVEKRFGFRSAADKVLQYLGCRVNQFYFTAPLEGIVGWRAGLIAKKEVDVSEGFDTPSTLDNSIENSQLAQYVADNEPFNSFHCAIEINGDPISTITTGDMTIDNNMDREGFALTGTPYRVDIAEGDRAISGNLNAFFTPDNYDLFYAAYLNNDDLSLRWTFTRGSRVLMIYLPAITIGGQVTPVISGKGPLNLQLTYDAHEAEDLGTDIQVVVTSDEPHLTTAA